MGGSGLPFPNPTSTGQWSKDLLTLLGDPLTASNVGYVNAWQNVESPSGFGYNPLGTEQTAPGSIHAPGNKATVQAFSSWSSGLSATVATFKGYAGNANLLNLLHRGNATPAQLSQAQRQGSWATGSEPGISGPAASTPFKYGGAHGLSPHAPGVAGKPNPTGWFGQWVEPILQNPVPLPGVTKLPGGSTTPGGGVISNAAGAALSPITGPFKSVISWAEKGAADFTFVLFGLVLIGVGLFVTFSHQAEEAAGTAAGAAAKAP